MSIDFRCENCGKLLSVEGDAGSSTKCPHCGKKVPVPAAVAALPRPKVAPNAVAAPPPPRANPETAPPHAEVAEEPVHESEVMTVMARIMPWIISVFFHAGVVMILTLAGLMAQGAAGANPDGSDDVIVPDAAWSDEPGGSLQPSKAAASNDNNTSTITRSDYAKRDAVADAGFTARRAAISVAGGISASVGSGSGKGDMLGLRSGGGGPKSTLFGKGGNAHHVVYVIDRSGSMLDTFDYVRREMLNSIGKLRPVQDFHVIFFAAGAKPEENPPQQLVTATPEYCTQAAEYLATIRPEGQTDPIPALKRAFQVLDKADPKKKGKLLYLLTDGAFPDPGKALEVVKQANAKKEVHIVTFLYGKEQTGKGKDPTVEFMKKLADENGGNFKLIAQNE